jgi:hypothetical protein
MLREAHARVREVYGHVETCEHAGVPQPPWTAAALAGELLNYPRATSSLAKRMNGDSCVARRRLATFATYAYSAAGPGTTDLA